MGMDQYHRYIFSGMNIHKSQLFWGSLGTRVLTHPQMGHGFWWKMSVLILECHEIRIVDDCWALDHLRGFNIFHHIPKHRCIASDCSSSTLGYHPISDWGMISVLKKMMVEQLGTWLGSQMFPGWLGATWGAVLLQKWLCGHDLLDFPMKKTCFFAMGFPMATFDDRRVYMIHSMVTSQLIDIHITWLVGGLVFFKIYIYIYVGNFIIPTDSYFSEG